MYKILCREPILITSTENTIENSIEITSIESDFHGDRISLKQSQRKKPDFRIATAPDT